MMNSSEFEEWSKRLNLTEEAKREIQRVRQSPPARRVGGGKKNVSGRYSSKKMGVTIQFESHKVELPMIYMMEFNDDVLEYYDQPPKIKIYYEQKNKKVSYWKTADFFVIEKNKAYWFECKKEEELIKQSHQNSERFFKENGKWIFYPGKEYAENFDLDFNICSSAEINWNLQRNLEFLEDYIVKEYVSDETKILRIKEAIISSPGLTLVELLQNSDNKFTVDDIYNLISKNEIYIDLYNNVITEPENVKIYLNKEQYKGFSIVKSNRKKRISCNVEVEIGNKILWGDTNWTIINYDYIGKTIFLYSENTKKNVELPMDLFESYISGGYIKGSECANNTENYKLKELVSQASKIDLEEANKKYEIVIKYLNGEHIELTVTDRTLRNWIKKYNDAEELYGNGYVGLLPQTKKRGNRDSKLPTETKDIMDKLILESYETIKSKSAKAVYRELLLKCDELDIDVPSYQTFCKAINSRSIYEVEKARKGERASYKHEEFYTELEFTTPKHGERIFEVGHIDHTELDIELNLNGKSSKRPWLTLMVDAYSRRIISFYLTFEEPSYRSCMMVIRECVKNYNRLPSYIIVDGGKEFSSIYFESLLALYGVHKKQRPAAKARYGSVIERLFGITNELFIHNLKGNTQITKNVRQVTKSVNPKNHAVWTLDTLYERLRNWIDSVYDNLENPSLSQTPKEAFEESIVISGKRPNTYIPYDENFILMTLPSPKGRTRKVQPGQGIKLTYSYYWCEQFRNPKIENTNVEVKYDPFNIGIAYAFINNRWVKCLSEQYKYLNRKTEKQVKLIAEEIRQKYKLYSKNNTITARMIASYILESEEIEEQLTFEKYNSLDNKNDESLIQPVEKEEHNNKSADIYDDDDLEIFEELI